MERLLIGKKNTEDSPKGLNVHKNKPSRKATLVTPHFLSQARLEHPQAITGHSIIQSQMSQIPGAGYSKNPKPTAYWRTSLSCGNHELGLRISGFTSYTPSFFFPPAALSPQRRDSLTALDFQRPIPAAVSRAASGILANPKPEMLRKDEVVSSRGLLKRFIIRVHDCRQMRTETLLERKANIVRFFCFHFYANYVLQKMRGVSFKGSAIYIHTYIHT